MLRWNAAYPDVFDLVEGKSYRVPNVGEIEDPYLLAED